MNSFKNSPYDPEQTNPMSTNKTSYEMNVNTPSPYRYFGTVDYKSVYSYLPDKFKNQFASLSLDPEFEPFWFNKLIPVFDHAIEFLLHKKYYDMNAVSGKYIFDVNYNTVDVDIIQRDVYKKVSYFEAVDHWKDLMSTRDIKLIFIYASICSKNGNSHANWVIIDKVRKVVDFVDPHGFLFQEVEDRKTNKWLIDFVSFFKKYFVFPKNTDGVDLTFCFIPRDYTINPYKDSCSKWGFQYFENKGLENYDLDLEGFCMLWNIFLLDLKLGNPHMTTRQGQKKMLEYYRSSVRSRHSKFKTPKDWIPEVGQEFKNFIRDYGLYLKAIYDERNKMSADQLILNNNPRRQIIQRKVKSYPF